MIEPQVSKVKTDLTTGGFTVIIHIYIYIYIWGGQFIPYVQIALEMAGPNTQSEDKKVSEDDH